MKNLVLLLAFTLGLSLSAANSVEAPGKVFYKDKAGAIVDREATLVVPAQGKGDVILKAGKVELKAHAFKAAKVNGRSVFVVVFLDPPGAPKKSAGIFHGTYSRGTNKAIYYGDIFFKKTALLRDSDVDAFLGGNHPGQTGDADTCQCEEGTCQPGADCGDCECGGQHQGNPHQGGQHPKPKPQPKMEASYVGGFSFEAKIK